MKCKSKRQLTLSGCDRQTWPRAPKRTRSKAPLVAASGDDVAAEAVSILSFESASEFKAAEEETRPSVPRRKIKTPARSPKVR